MGLEFFRGLKLANIPLSTSEVVLYCDLCKYGQLFWKMSLENGKAKKDIGQTTDRDFNKKSAQVLFMLWPKA